MWWQIKRISSTCMMTPPITSIPGFVFCSMEAAEGLIKGWGEDGDGISEAYFYVADAAHLD